MLIMIVTTAKYLMSAITKGNNGAKNWMLILPAILAVTSLVLSPPLTLSLHTYSFGTGNLRSFLFYI